VTSLSLRGCGRAGPSLARALWSRQGILQSVLKMALKGTVWTVSTGHLPPLLPSLWKGDTTTDPLPAP
jgi:hypothetical protein